MEFENLKYHPRVLELRVSLIHSMFVMEFGSEKTQLLFKEFCDIATINYTVIASMLGRKRQILKLNTIDKLRYRQEVLIMGLAWGETRENIGKKYLNITRSTLYGAFDGQLKTDVFFNERWAENLDYSIEVAGVDAFRIESTRLVNFFEGLSKVIT